MVVVFVAAVGVVSLFFCRPLLLSYCFFFFFVVVVVAVVVVVVEHTP